MPPANDEHMLCCLHFKWIRFPRHKDFDSVAEPCRTFLETRLPEVLLVVSHSMVKAMAGLEKVCFAGTLDWCAKAKSFLVTDFECDDLLGDSS